MKAFVLASLVVVLTVTGCGTGKGPASAQPEVARKGPAGAEPEVLTNETIIGMATSHVDRDLLLSKINTMPNAFDVTREGLVNLYQSRVNEEVIKAMILMASNAKLGAPPSKTPEVLDNEQVILMVTSKLPRQVVIAKIQSTEAAFDVSSSGLVGLSQAKVPKDVIQAMVWKRSGPSGREKD